MEAGMTRIVRAGRRDFVRTLFGAGAAAAGLGLESTLAGAPATDALLLCCIDYRLVDETERYMTRRGLRNKYDQVILAGAALGALSPQYPAWGTTFWDHLGLAIELHQIHKVMLMDHRDCGAYKVILGEDLSKDPARETTVHAGKLKELATAIVKKHPKLEVELLLMALDGKVEKVS
jgi:carbonic anhydrase